MKLHFVKKVRKLFSNLLLYIVLALILTWNIIYYTCIPCQDRPDINFNENTTVTIPSISRLPPLTYVEKRNNHYDVKLQINNSAIDFYNFFYSPTCCYTKIEFEFENSSLPKDCTPFTTSVDIVDPLIKVTCKKITNQEVYTNIHPIISPMFTPSMSPTTYDLLSRSEPAFSVLLFGINGISKKKLKETMPKTYGFLQQKHFINLPQKIEENTSFLLAMLTGLANGEPKNYCDEHNIWNDFKEAGYTTVYGDDLPFKSRFTCGKNDFLEPPTDLYFRPYMFAVESLRKSSAVSYRTSPEDRTERLMHLVEDFQTTFHDFPTFALFVINKATATDTKVEKFLNNLYKHIELGNTFFFFFSENLDNTRDKSTFFYVFPPSQFEKKYFMYYYNLKSRTGKLSNPFEVYMTLQAILQLASPKYQIRRNVGYPLSQSFFSENRRRFGWRRQQAKRQNFSYLVTE